MDELAVWKFTLLKIDHQIICVPPPAEILTVATQHDEPQIWFLVDPNKPPTQDVEIFTVGTGHHTPKASWTYIGSYQLNDGYFVGHVFYAKK